MASVSYRKAENENRTEQHVQQADNITRHGFRQEIEKKKNEKKQQACLLSPKDFAVILSK